MDDYPTRQQKLRNDMARKALLVVERSRRTDNQGRISAQSEEEAMIAAGFREPPAPPPPPSDEVRLNRIEAANRNGLTLDDARAMTGETPAEIELEAKSMREPVPPGEGGARTPVPPVDPIVEAEKNHDWKTAMSLKSQKLLDISAAKAQRNHPNAPR